METIKFEVGNVYEMTFITDADLRVPYICVKRTAKTVSFERFKNTTERLNKKIKVYNNTEYVLKGDYSMSPMIKANRLIK